MLQRALAGVVVARLVLAPWAGAEESTRPSGPIPGPIPGPIAAAATQEAARAAAADTRAPMHNGLKWTGIALMLAGGATVFTTAIGNCGRSCGEPAVGYGVGGAEFLAGSILIAIGEHRRKPLTPTLVVRDGRAIVQQRISF